MKVGSEDKKKLYVAGTLGAIALGYALYTFVGGSSDTPTAPAPASPTIQARNTPSPVVAKVSRTASDPTLHPEGMELTEQLQYTGSGRNIFAANSAPIATVAIPKPIASARIQSVQQMPVNTGPPPPPPIDLRFFGTATKADGQRQAFFVRGDDVFLAMQGDVVGRRYRVGAIGATSVEVTDLTNNNTQRLPLAQQ